VANFNIVFSPTFKHTDWVDNLDRVQAGGTNGFNIRFQALLTDQAALVGLFNQINAALVGLSTPPTPTTKTLTLSLGLLPQLDPSNLGPAGPTQNLGWTNLLGIVVLPSQRTVAEGIMPVNLPDGATIQAMRVYGRNTGNGTLTVKLLALPFNDSSNQPIVIVSGVGSAPFGVAVNASTANSVNVVKVAGFHYVLTVTVAGASLGDFVQLYSVQVDYLPA
jgi:hypothetical protein